MFFMGIPDKVEEDSRILASEGPGNPLNPVAVEGTHVETAIRPPVTVVLLQPGLGGQTDTALLGRRNRRCGAPKQGACASPDLNKYERLALHHDEVDFPNATLDLPVDQSQARGKEIGKRLVLGTIAVLLRRGAGHPGIQPVREENGKMSDDQNRMLQHYPRAA
jgi:hypothetical protein